MSSLAPSPTTSSGSVPSIGKEAECELQLALLGERKDEMGPRRHLNLAPRTRRIWGSNSAPAPSAALTPRWAC